MSRRCRVTRHGDAQRCKKENSHLGRCAFINSAAYALGEAGPKSQPWLPVVRRVA